MLNLSSNKEALNYKYFFRGIYNKVVNENAKRVEVIKAEKLKRYDNFLRKFKYSDALAHALSTFDTQIIVSIIEELLLREGLEVALKGLSDEAMINLLNFIHKKCDSSNHQQIVLLVFEKAMELLNQVGRYQAEDIDAVLVKISDKMALEEETIA